MRGLKEFVHDYFQELSMAARNISSENFDLVVDTLLGAYKRGCSIFVMGNGGSASTASHFSCDINKGVSLGLAKRFRMICLNDNIPTMLAYANDNAYEDIFVEQLKNFLEPGDVVIGISGSGNSGNVIKAIQYANGRDATTISFTGFDGGKLAKIARVSMVIPVNDMQKVEDIHLILTHILMQFLHKSLSAEK